MLTVHRTETTSEPAVFVNLGTGYWYYNYDIQPRVVQVPTYIPEDETEETLFEDQTWYNYVQVRLYGKPTYNACVKAIIRKYIDSDTEFNLINTYNADQLAELESNPEYVEYLELVKQIKEKVRQDFSLGPKVRPVSQRKTPDELKILASLLINNVSVTDDQALQMQSLYPVWASGAQYVKGNRLQYDGKLYKVLGDHVAGEMPDDNDSEILAENTVDTPYPFTGKMALYINRYYIEDGIIYQCIESTDSILLSKLAESPKYVQKIETVI